MVSLWDIEQERRDSALHTGLFAKKQQQKGYGRQIQQIRKVVRNEQESHPNRCSWNWKTYLAKGIAEAMNAEYEFVQFHPSYDYTDFVEGLRPTPPDGNGNIGFERKDGVFKEFCKKAIKGKSMFRSIKIWFQTRYRPLKTN